MTITQDALHLGNMICNDRGNKVNRNLLPLFDTITKNSHLLGRKVSVLHKPENIKNLIFFLDFPEKTHTI